MNRNDIALKHLNDGRTRSANQPGYPSEIRGYDGVSRITAHRWIECTLDANGFPTGYVNPATPLLGFRHAWNAADNKLSQELMHGTDKSEAYKYDSAYRLKRFDRGTLNAALTDVVTPTPIPNILQAQAFTLDGPGNWPSTTTTTNGVPTTETRTHNNLNQITAINAVPLTYDSNGNTSDDRDFLHAYDAKNRLRRVTRKSDNVVVGLYSYDALGRRIRRVYIVGADPAKTVHYYLDAQRVIEEREVEGGPPAEVFKRQYTYGPYIDECLTLDRDLNGNGIATDPGERLFYHANTLYSIYAVSDSNRVQPERYLYDAYGRPILWLGGPDGIYGTADDTYTLNGATTVQNVRLLTGRDWTPESLLHFYRARNCAPNFGRFLSREPLLGFNSANLYPYVGNRPTVRLDASGRMSSADIRDKCKDAPPLSKDDPKACKYGGKIRYCADFVIDNDCKVATGLGYGIVITLLGKHTERQKQCMRRFSWPVDCECKKASDSKDNQCIRGCLQCWFDESGEFPKRKDLHWCVVRCVGGEFQALLWEAGLLPLLTDCASTQGCHVGTATEELPERCTDECTECEKPKCAQCPQDYTLPL